ncbi:helix-turn-helix domain-containing protein [uncultured Citricoccus sp.]|nr:helix-turn-helix domain-containing protein [uncultured Citricoccus sp.]HRO31295.1 helix-turn-helix domain-containing protein [Citricoccus sp.]
MVKPQDVADDYGVHVNTVYRLIQRGVLTSHRVGHQHRLDPEQVAAAFRR